MDLPPNLQRGVNAITSGAVNTRGTSTIVNAPAAGYRIRVWAWAASVNNTAQTPARVIWELTNGTLSASYDFASTVGFGSVFHEYPGGFAYSTADAVLVGCTADIASLNAASVVFYTVELA